MRTRSKILRLTTEKVILEKEMPQFSFYEPRRPTKTYVAGWIKTSDGNKYRLKLVLGEHFPDEMPELYVDSPHRLPKRDGGLINDVGLSHAFHTRSNDVPGGSVQICHCNSSSWDPSKTISSILIKGILWCEGYRKYLKTGKSIAAFLSEVQKQVPDVRKNY